MSQPAIRRLAETEEGRAVLEAGLHDPVLALAATQWRYMAREQQLPPEGNWLVWLMLAGRRGGKTRAGAEWIIERAKANMGPIALIGETACDVRDVMVELGPSSILKCSRPDFMPRYQPSKRRLTWPNGCTATTFSGDEPDQLRGPGHQTIWGDEIAKWNRGQESWDNALMGLSQGTDPRVCLTTTPRPLKLLIDIIDSETTVVAKWSSYENLDNLAPDFREQILSKYEGTRLGRQELHAEILKDTPGALWTMKMIEETRVKKPPALVRVVVGVDPQGSKGVGETGIVVVGLGENGHLYVMSDYSIDGSPMEWGNAVIAAYQKTGADSIIAERNFGGDMVPSTIRTADPNAPVTVISASRGKYPRAQPVASMHEQGRVHYVGTFPVLENEQTTWVPGDPNSPNRMDAMVWAATDLMGGDMGPVGYLV